jgi:DNA-directed RNA polymerase subunit RPC12/RpoP
LLLWEQPATKEIVKFRRRIMNIRTFLKGFALLSSYTFLTGCMAKVSSAANDESQGTPYQCERCGYLTRSHDDLTDVRCPRCQSKQLRKISEVEMEKALNPAPSDE